MGSDALAGVDVEAHIRATVDVFLRAYAADPEPGEASRPGDFRH
jgi:hypothetical protein